MNLHNFLRSHVKMSVISISFVCLFGSGAWADQLKNEEIALQHAVKAIQKGYGRGCDLRHRPLDVGKVWDCIDIGSYRIEVQYGKEIAYVILANDETFKILERNDDGIEFTVKGPWQSDFAKTVENWWNDEILGGKKRLETDEALVKKYNEASEKIKKNNSNEIKDDNFGMPPVSKSLYDQPNRKAPQNPADLLGPGVVKK